MKPVVTERTTPHKATNTGEGVISSLFTKTKSLFGYGINSKNEKNMFDEREKRRTSKINASRNKS